MARRKRHVEEANHEAWAIPYGDLLTLLLAFFVVMYAISQVNEGKYRVLADALNAEFRGQPSSMEPLQVGDKQRGSGADIKISVVQQQMLNGQPRELLDVRSVEKKPDDNKAAKADAPSAEVLQTARVLDRVADQVETTMSNLIRENLVAVRRHALWVEVEIKTDILFGSGSAMLSPLAMSVLQPIADTIKPYDNSVRVEGHTDNIPINTREFPSNWELSAARAASVVQLFVKRGVDPARLTVVGYGEYHPAQPNTTLEGRNANRRVVLVILDKDDGLAADKTRKQ